MKKKILALSITLALVAVLLAPMAALGANTGTQNASTSSSTSIDIVAKTADTAISSITFPEGAAGATVSAPYNNLDSTGDPQVLDAAASEPVVRLLNNSAGTLNVTLEISSWTGAVASEDYELVATTTTNIETVASVLSSDGNSNSVATGTGIAASGYLALYLEVVLSASSGASGSSTLTVLGETP